jgi:sn-glycerol 3-phosphate transport system ATP-binding protein
VAGAFEAAVGREVEIGIRPEDLRFGSGAEGELAFTKDFVEELGATRLFHGTSGGAAVVVAVAAAAADDAGGSVTADREAVHLFDPATGNSLRR